MKKTLTSVLLFLTFFAVGKEKIKIACIGDSITYGLIIQDRENNAYPNVLQKLIGEKFEVNNFGNSGRGILKRSMRGREKRAYIFMKENTDALEFAPKIVICNLGINDLMDWEKKILGSDKKYGDEFCDNYIELIQQYRQLPSNPVVFLWTPLAPLFKGHKLYGNKNVAVINNEITKVVKKLNSIKTAIIEGKKVKLAPVYIIDMETSLKDKEDLFPDKIHPNAEGAKIIAEETNKALRKNLPKYF